MKNECKIAYEAQKETIKKHASDQGMNISFEEKYPYRVKYSITPPQTLFDEAEKPDDIHMLHIAVTIGGVTVVSVAGIGEIYASQMKKMIKTAEALAEMFFRAEAEKQSV